MVALEEVSAPDDLALLHRLIDDHVRWTGSALAGRILAHWHDYLPRFVKVMPHDLRRVLAEREAEPLRVQAV
jgi:glutamate synthase domain-containing protein 3